MHGPVEWLGRLEAAAGGVGSDGEAAVTGHGQNGGWCGRRRDMVTNSERRRGGEVWVICWEAR